jgi:hypothetical protein
MSEKFGFAEDEGLPQYEESTTSPRALLSSDSKDLPRPSLHTQLTETRTRRIQNLLATYIEPLLYSQFLDGIYKRSFILIPADILTKQHNLAAKDIVGLPDAGNVSVIRLHGDANRAAFWQQPGVLKELTSSLRAGLAASGHKVQAPSDNAPADSALQSPPVDQIQRRNSPSWLKKQFSTPGPEHDPTATTNYKLGWRAEEEDVASRKLGLDEIRVLVKVRDVSFRVETEMGLLDSVTGKILWLELEVGT